MIRTLFLLCFSLSFGYSQNVNWEDLSPLPEAVSNNAVATVTVNDTPYVYSFTGIDESKDWFGIHLKSFRLNTISGVWESLEDVPDDLGGKIAASADVVKGKIYIIGGYHVASNYSETSSSKVHVFDPVSNTFLEDGADIPVAIDDQVQAVWRDSLIFVVTGWSNTTNVPNVQIYNPTNDEWQVGTSVPNQNSYKAFGATGMIIGDTIYYSGGAQSIGNFPASTFFRKGYINPNDPTDISWEGFPDVLSKGYRMGAGKFEGKGIWIGGSQDTYNFDGIAYNGSGGVAATDRILLYDPETAELTAFEGDFPNTMDMRNIAQISDNEYILVGGMTDGQAVTNRVIKMTLSNDVVSTEEKNLDSKLTIAPNPTNGEIYISGLDFDLVELYDLNGRLLMQSVDSKLNLAHLAKANYWLKLWKDQEMIGQEKIIKQ